MMVHSINRRIVITEENLACIGLFFYLIKNPVRTILASFLHTSGAFNTWTSIFLMYFPLLLIPIISKKRRKVFDFACIWLFMLISCLVTSIFHPEYNAWLFEGEFNIWLSIFRPDQGIYLYLFIRMIDEPNKILTTFEKAASILLAYNLYKYYYSTRVLGYWVGTGISRGAEGEYNLGFGYDVLFLFVIFTILGKNKNKWYYALSVISLYCIVMAGSRGPLLGVCLTLLILLMDVIKNQSAVQKVILLILFALISTLIIVNFTNILLAFAYANQRVGLSSRTIVSIISGNTFEDTGRSRLYQIAFDLIRTGGPFGNGIYGDRYVISSQTTMWIGYCHEIALEILVDYGYLLGGAILVFLICRIVKILRASDSEWRNVYLILLISASQLILSGSYLYISLFWGAMAAGVCWSERYGRNMVRKRVSFTSNKINATN